MNKYFIVFAFAILSNNIYAQVENVPAPPPAQQNYDEEDKIFSRVEMEAEFAGGQNALRNYLEKNLNIDKVAKKIKLKRKQKVFQETAIVKFIVQRNGSLSDVVIENEVHPAIAAEAIRVIKDSPNWIPAQQNGRVVNAYGRQPITFRIEAE